jgi:hypothetical protein
VGLRRPLIVVVEKVSGLPFADTFARFDLTLHTLPLLFLYVPL